MKIYLVVFLCLLMFLILLAYPFKISFKMHVNAISLKAFYSIKVMFIKLLCGTTYIEDGALVIQNSHNLIYNTMQNSAQQLEIIKGIVSKISVSKLQIYFSGGIQNNAYQTAMLCGHVYALTSALLGFFITKNNCIDVFQDIDPQYNKDTLDITLKCLLEISILDIIIAVITSRIKYKEKLSGKEK